MVVYMYRQVHSHVYPRHRVSLFIGYGCVLSFYAGWKYVGLKITTQTSENRQMIFVVISEKCVNTFNVSHGLGKYIFRSNLGPETATASFEYKMFPIRKSSHDF